MTMLPDGRFAVPVSINGTAHEFMVDTAGVFSEIDADAAQTLGLQETPAVYDMYGASGKLHINAATVKSFMVGNNEAKNFHVGVRHPAAGASAKQDAGEKPGIDGLLAPDFLSLFDMELDFAAKKMNLFSPDHCAGKVVYWTRSGYAELPFRFTSGALAATWHIQLQMTLDGHGVSTDLDTGSAGSFMQKKAAVQIFGIDETSSGVVKSPYGTDASPMSRKQFGSLSLGGLTVQNPQIDILQDLEESAFRMEHSEKSRDDPIYGNQLRSENLILGMNVLSKLHLYIAYKEHELYLTAVDAR